MTVQAIAIYRRPPMPVLPDHVVAVDGTYFTDITGDTTEVTGQEIVYIEPHTVMRPRWEGGIRFLYPVHPPFYAHACPLPEGYLKDQIAVNHLHQRTVQSHLRVAADARIEEEGYTSKAEFARAMLAEHLQETAHIAREVSDTAVVGDRLVKYGHVQPASTGDDSRYLLTPDEVKARVKAKLAAYLAKNPDPKNPREFNVSDFIEHPSELIDTPAYKEDLAAAMRALVGLSDWSPSLAYGQLKQWDSLAAGYERDLFNLVPYGRKIHDEINQLYRESDAEGDEIPRAQLERLVEKLRGFREQYHDFQCRYATALIERERAVNASGIDFGPYRTLAERAKMGAAAARAKNLATKTELDRLNSLKPLERQKELKALKDSGLLAYRARFDGVDVDGPDRRVAAQTIGE